MQFDRHELRFYQNYFPSNFTPGQFDIDAYGFDETGKSGSLDPLDGARKPTTASAYVQNRYERGGLVANIGLRYDYLNVNAKALKNEDLPLGTDNVLTSDDLTDAKTYSRISPRIGIGFPFTDVTVLHVNWGQFYQQPNLQDLYVSYRFLEYKVRKGGYYVPFGNPNLKPEMTTAYEVGVAHQLNEYSKMDISVYYKDVRDLVQVANIPSRPYSFASFRNKDFATLKGVDVGVHAASGESHQRQPVLQPVVRAGHRLGLEHAAQHRLDREPGAAPDLTARLRPASQAVGEHGPGLRQGGGAQVAPAHVPVGSGPERAVQRRDRHAVHADHRHRRGHAAERGAAAHGLAELAHVAVHAVAGLQALEGPAHRRRRGCPPTSGC